MIDSETWEAIRTSITENAFITKLMRSIWGRRAPAVKTMKGVAKHQKSPPQEIKTPVTPLKLNVLLVKLYAICSIRLGGLSWDEIKFQGCHTSGKSGKSQ